MVRLADHRRQRSRLEGRDLRALQRGDDPSDRPVSVTDERLVGDPDRLYPTLDEGRLPPLSCHPDLLKRTRDGVWVIATSRCRRSSLDPRGVLHRSNARDRLRDLILPGEHDESNRHVAEDPHCTRFDQEMLPLVEPHLQGEHPVRRRPVAHELPEIRRHLPGRELCGVVPIVATLESASKLAHPTPETRRRERNPAPGEGANPARLRTIAERRVVKVPPGYSGTRRQAKVLAQQVGVGPTVEGDDEDLPQRSRLEIELRGTGVEERRIEREEVFGERGGDRAVRIDDQRMISASRGASGGAVPPVSSMAMVLPSRGRHRAVITNKATKVIEVPSAISTVATTGGHGT